MKEKTEDLKKYFEASYPNAEFSIKFMDNGDFRASLENFIGEEKVQILLVPNKKMNIFARIFRPGIAHKILFEKDIPMLALPV